MLSHGKMATMIYDDAISQAKHI